jgi:hypothetical protein
MVSTAKKSHSTIAAACWRRNSRQLTFARLGAGSMPWHRKMFHTVLGATSGPRNLVFVDNAYDFEHDLAEIYRKLRVASRAELNQGVAREAKWDSVSS